MRRVMFPHMLLLAAIFTFAVEVGAQVHANVGTSTYDEGVDADLRTGPVTIQGDQHAPLSDADYGKFPFLHLQANHIEYNGDDWSALRRRIAAIDDTVVSIVHIGDSHLQAEGATQRTRDLLQRFYGSSGRGLITPFKLAGTNQPSDYSISASGRMATSTIMRRPWSVPMGFTGVAMQPEAAEFSITLGVNNSEDVSNEFDVVRIYGHGPMPAVKSVKSGNSHDIRFKSRMRGDTISVTLMEPVNNATICFERDPASKCAIHGFKLENSMTGIEYHVIGNNGARYDVYNSFPSFASDIRSLSPNLIIVSLGANEAFGNISDASFYSNVDRMVKGLRQNNPDARVLLVTPGECQKSGKPNTDIKRLRDVILQYGRDNHVATYDWFEVAGGDGSSVFWLNNGLLSHDRIHNTWPGYILQGNLFYDALIRAFNPTDYDFVP